MGWKDLMKNVTDRSFYVSTYSSTDWTYDTYWNSSSGCNCNYGCKKILQINEIII